MWEKWMTTDCTMTDESFMVMIRDINLDCDVVNATLARKDLTSTKKEHLIYDVSVWKIVKGSERFDICRDHLLDKSVSSNCYPLAIKYRFAAQYFDDKISLIEYDRSYFKTEEHRFAQFFFSQTEKQTYKQHPLFKTLADRYLLICQKDEEDFVKIVETLDEAFDTLDNRKKWCNSSWLSFNWKFRLAKGTGDFDLIMKPVQENIDKLDARQLDDIVMLVNSYEDDFRKQEID